MNTKDTTSKGNYRGKEDHHISEIFLLSARCPIIGPNIATKKPDNAIVPPQVDMPLILSRLLHLQNS